jgi:hypothetical protein
MASEHKSPPSPLSQMERLTNSSDPLNDDAHEGHIF